jgi:hypothetical protein
MSAPAPENYGVPRPILGVIAGAALLLAALAIYLLRLDHVAGLIGDDAWYIEFAKSIAQGVGPRLINSAGPHVVEPLYPPGFPALLALVFLVSPQFPANVLLLKAVSVAAMIGAGLLTYRYASRYRGLSRPVAAAVAFGTVITPALVFLATSTVMSEPVFLCAELGAVLAIERAAAERSTRWPMFAGALAAATMFVRTAGIAVPMAGILYFVVKRRWRHAIVFGAAFVLCTLPWSIYARTHAASRADLVDHGGVMAIDYASWFWKGEAGTIASRTEGVDVLPARVERNVANIAIRDMGGILMPALFRTPAESGLEVLGLAPPEGGKVPSMGSALGTKAISAALTLLALAGFALACRQRLTFAEPLVVATIGMVALWPFPTFRFVLPLAPFLLTYLVVAIGALASTVTRRDAPILAPAAAVRILLLVVIGLNLLDHAQYIAQVRDNDRASPWKSTDVDVTEVLNWLRDHGAPGGVVAATNPALVYLVTGLPTVSITSLGDRWERWDKMHVRYLVALSTSEEIGDPRRTVLRFKLSRDNLWVVEVLPREGAPAPPVNSSTHMPERADLNSSR